MSLQKDWWTLNLQVPSDGRHRWIVVDDLMEEVTNKPEMRTLFTKHSHHRKLSVFFIVQNLHHSGIREISLNSQYIFVFKSPRDLAQIGYIGREIYPTNSKLCNEKLYRRDKGSV